MDKHDVEKKLEIIKINTKIINCKTKLSNCINKNYIYVLLLINSIIASISSNEIKITISGSGNIRIIDINGRRPNNYCIENGQCGGSQFSITDNILYYNKNNQYNILVVKFNTKLSNLNGLFKNCKDITSIDFKNFDFSDVYDTSEMFQNCTYLTSINFGSNTINNIIKMSYMFYNCSSLKEINLLKFKTSNVGKMDGMFELCSNLIKLEQNFDTSKVVSMEKMFSNCENLDSLDITNFDVSSVTNMNSMFKGCKKLNSLKLFNSKTISLINMGSMFQSCSSLENLDLLSNFETSSVQFMNDLFHDCTSLISPTKFEFNTEKVIKMESMFENCKKLTKLDLSSFYTPSLRQIYSMFSGCSSITTINISNFDTFQITNFANLFANCISLVEINLNNFETKMVTNMTQMFCNCTSLTNIDISNFDTKSLKEMNSMFKGCSSLEELNLTNLLNPNVYDMSNMFSGCKKLDRLITDNFGTSNVKYMNGMFSGCLGFTNLNLNFLETSNVINMNSMFSGCSNLVSINIARFNTSNTLDIGSMFSDCTSLTSIDLSNFDTSQVTNMDSMFLNCKNIKSLSLSSFDTSNVQSMKSLFQGCSSFQFLYLSNFKTENVLYMDSLFSGCNSLIKLDLNNLTLNKVNSMGYMFYGCKSLISLILPNFRKLSVTNTSNMFAGCSSLEKIDLSYFDSSSIKYMDFMFADCSYLKEINLDNWNTRSVRTMNYLFSGCSSLTSLDITSFITPQLTTIRGMFYSCSLLKYIDLSNLTTSLVVNMEYMFYKAFSLTSIEFYKYNNSSKYSYFKTSYVENMKYMFAYCSSLKNLDLSFFDTSKVNDMSYMFKDCFAITSLNLSSFDLDKVTTMEKMFENCTNITYINLIKSNDKNVKNMNNILYGTPLNMVFCINENSVMNIAGLLTKDKGNCYNISCALNYEEHRKKIFKDGTLTKCVGTCSSIDKYNYLYQCYDECPPNITFYDKKPDEIDRLCETLDKKPPECTIQNIIMNNHNCTLEDYKIKFNNTNENKVVLINKIKEEIKYFDIIIPLLVKKKQIITYKVFNETYQFSEFSNKIKIDNLTFIDFQDCENILKKSKDLDSNKESLILFKIEYTTEDFKIPIIEYKIFTEDGKEEFDINNCKNLNFIYSIPVEINISEEYKYNPRSEYNNDLCFPFTTDNLTDIILYDRKKEFNERILSLCESNCKYLRYVNGRVECECPVKSDFNKFLTKSDEQKENMIFKFKDYNIEPYNFGVLKCYNMIFTKESFKRNYANIIFIVMMLLNAVSAIIFWAKEYKELYIQAVLLANAIDTKPFLKANKNIKIVKNNNLITTGNNPPPKIKKDINSKKSNFVPKNINNKIKNTTLNDSIIKEPSNLIDSKNELDLGLDKKNSILSINLDDELEQTLLKTDMEINMLSYSEAIKQDKRNCFNIYVSFLKTRHILICIFTRDFNAVLFKVSFFFFIFGICIGINTFFFDERLIQKIYEQKGKYSIQKHINNQMASIIISCMVASIIKSIIANLTFTDIEILSIKEKNKLPQEEKINNAIMKVSSKATKFFVINFIFMIIFWIYSSSFSAVFKNTQKYLFLSAGISLVIVMFLPLLYYFFAALLRTIALNGKNSSYLYKFSKFIELI